jgi:hypothetical protein
MGKNNGYSLGNVFKANTWLQRSFGTQWVTWFRLNVTDESQINGFDPKIQEGTVAPRKNKYMGTLGNVSPDFFTFNYGGTKLKANIGASYELIGGFTMGVEGGIPLYQNLNGTQMSDTWQIQTGFQQLF